MVEKFSGVMRLSGIFAKMGRTHLPAALGVEKSFHPVWVIDEVLNMDDVILSAVMVDNLVFQYAEQPGFLGGSALIPLL